MSKVRDLVEQFRRETKSISGMTTDAWLTAHGYHVCPCNSRRVGRIVVDHGSHGPEPKFKGDVWTVSYRCSVCGKHIGKDDAYCKHCGVELEAAE